MSQTFNSEDEIRPITPPVEDVIRARWTRHGECLVSVSMLCFNHAPFVRKALDGVLSQQTDFGFEILVHDDASTDESASIIREYAERYPNIVKPIFQSENQYSQGIYPSVHFNYPRAQSAFVAICEADDCWIDCGKLQAQVDALLAHPGIDLAFHQAHRIDVSRAESVFELMGDYASEDQVVPWIEIVHRRHGPLPTASCIIRQNAFRQFVDFLRDRDYLTIGDLYLQFFGALRGGAFYVARPMSVYRVNTQHSWSRGVTTDPVRKIRHELAMIQSYCELDEITHFAFREEFQKLIVQRIFWLFDSELVTPEIIVEHGLGELADVHRRLLDVTATDDMMPITDPSDRYVIYGAGSGCGLVMRSLRREDVAAIIDLYGGKVGQRMFDIPVVALSDLPKFREHPLIVSTFAYDRNTFEHLINDYGFDEARIIYFYRRMVDMIDVRHLRQLSAKVLGRLAPTRRAVLPPSSGSAARGTTGRRSQELPAAYRPRVLTLEWQELPSATFSSGTEQHAYAAVTPKATYSPWRGDQAFLDAYARIQGLTLVDIYRCYELWTLVRQAGKRQGDIIEIGVWRGGTAALIGRASSLFAANRTLYLCDTFAGVVKASARDHHYRGREHADTSMELVRGALSLLGVSDAALLEGVFPEDTARRLPSDVSFALAHIDVDTYESARDCFEYLWPRMAIGGAIVFDDYGFQACSGVTTFCNEIAMLTDCMFVHNLNGHAVMIKTEE